jgi:AraC-like DNA-binding protein
LRQGDRAHARSDGQAKGRSDGLLRELEDPKTVRGRVEAVLLPLFHTGAVGTDAVARTLGVSRQTLFRKLKTEDVTRKQVLDALRRRRALRDLTGAKTSVNETAYRLSFPRASKRWTGMSPPRGSAGKGGRPRRSPPLRRGTAEYQYGARTDLLRSPTGVPDPDVPLKESRSLPHGPYCQGDQVMARTSIKEAWRYGAPGTTRAPSNFRLTLSH